MSNISQHAAIGELNKLLENKQIDQDLHHYLVTKLTTPTIVEYDKDNPEMVASTKEVVLTEEEMAQLLASHRRATMMSNVIQFVGDAKTKDPFIKCIIGTTQSYDYTVDFSQSKDDTALVEVDKIEWGIGEAMFNEIPQITILNKEKIQLKVKYINKHAETGAIQAEIMLWQNAYYWLILRSSLNGANRVLSTIPFYSPIGEFFVVLTTLAFLCQAKIMSDQIIELKPCFTYCRVSSRKQVTEGNGLSSQLQECKEYAKKHGYKIIQSFQDEAISGGDRERDGLDKMLEQCQKNPNWTVLFPSTSRLARDTIFLLSTVKLLREKYKYSVQFFNLFGIDLKTDAGWLMLTMIGGQDEFMRKNNATTVMSKQLARLQQGFHIYQPPLGYTYEKTTMGKMIVPNQQAEGLKNVMEDFANGRFEGYKEMEDYLQSIGIKRRGDDLKKTLANPLYAGFIHKPDLGIDMWDDKYESRPNAKHKPIIDLITYVKILERLGIKSRSIQKSSDNDTFCYKRLAKCFVCNNYLCSEVQKKKLATKTLEFTYYKCCNRNCSQRNKTISFAKINDEVINYVARHSLIESEVELIKNEIETKTNLKILSDKKELARLDKEIAKLKEYNKDILDKIITCKSKEVMESLEQLTINNNNQILEYKKQITLFEPTKKTELLNVSNQMLKLANNLDIVMIKSSYENKKKLLSVVFPDGFVVQKQEQIVFVSNQQKSPLLRDYWDDFLLGFRFGG